MESKVSPKNIEARVEAMAAANNAKPVETPAPEAKAPEAKAPEAKAPEAKEPEVKAPEAKAPEAKAPEAKAPEAKAPEVKAPEVKAPEAKPEVKEKKAPNDPNELRKWSTKLSQENAQLREDMKTLKAAIEKLSKKPVDYAELAKNPDGLKAHIEAERQEAVKELQTQLVEKHNLAVKNETVVERMKRESDKENYPRWEKLFPLIQTLANNADGRINWNQPPGNALDEAYALADQLSPAETPAAPAVPTPTPTPAPVGLTEAEVAERIAKAVAEATAKTKAETEAALRAEIAGGGIGSSGKGGRRDTTVSKEALQKMPLKDLKNLISQ